MGRIPRAQGSEGAQSFLATVEFEFTSSNKCCCSVLPGVVVVLALMRHPEVGAHDGLADVCKPTRAQKNPNKRPWMHGLLVALHPFQGNRLMAGPAPHSDFASLSLPE